MNEKELINLTKTPVDKLPDDVKLLKVLLKYHRTEIQLLKERVQKLEDEINRLKGEKGKPEFKKNKTKDKTLGDFVKDKIEKKEHKKSSKKIKNIPIQERKKIEIEQSVCPRCGKSLNKNGNKKIVIQDIEFKLNNTEYELESKCCSNKDCNYVITASLPNDLKGQEFGNDIRSLTPFLHYNYGLSQNQLYNLFLDIGLVISEGTVNDLIQNGGKKCINLADNIFNYHLRNSTVFNIDETGWKTKGINKYLYVISNKFMNYFSIRDKRNSNTVKDILFQGNWDNEAADLVANVFIITDDHSTYSENKVRTLGRQLCWVHENRHYKKLIPFTKNQLKEGEKVLSELWDLYRDIQEYRKRNVDKGYNEPSAKKIEKRFDDILHQKITWKDLKHQMSLTFKKKYKLLLCLKYPFIEPHNNRAEQDLRPCVVIRNKNFGTRSQDGEKHFSSARSIIGTLRKLGKNVYESFKKVMNETINIQELLPT